MQRLDRQVGRALRRWPTNTPKELPAAPLQAPLAQGCRTNLPTTWGIPMFKGWMPTTLAFAELIEREFGGFVPPPALQGRPAACTGGDHGRDAHATMLVHRAHETNWRSKCPRKAVINSRTHLTKSGSFIASSNSSEK